MGTQSPREKVKHCQIMYTCLKTTVSEATHGKQCQLFVHLELFNMEELIPLLIFIINQSDIGTIKNELDLMVDFIGFDPCDLESERRLLVNMSVSHSLLRNPSTTFHETGKFNDSFYLLSLYQYFLSNPICYQSKILSRGSFAFSSVSLYLFSLTRASNYFLNSGRENSSPITHSEAETLYFFALFNKIISSCSGFMIWSTRLKMLTKFSLTYLLKARKQHNKPPCSHRSDTEVVFLAAEKCHCLNHLIHRPHSCL